MLTIISLVCIPVGLAVTRKIAKFTRKCFSELQKELGELNGYIEETISGQRVVKAFCHEAEAVSHFSDINQCLKNVGMSAQIYSGIIPPVMNIINNFSFALVAAAGGLMAAKGLITVGVIASFINYAKQFARPINEIANQFNMIQSAIAGAERVFEVMDEEPEFEDKPEAPYLKNVAGEVTFKDVDFGYKKDVPVLKNGYI
jgi:ATP-binding cassette subfamily B protein